MQQELCKQLKKVMKYTTQSQKLDENLQTILSSIHKDFSSQEFIEAYHRICPDLYAAGVREAGDFRRLHSWIARWYLLGKVKAHILLRINNPRNDRKWRQI